MKPNLVCCKALPFITALLLMAFTSSCETTGEQFQQQYQNSDFRGPSHVKDTMDRLTDNGRTLPSADRLAKAIDPGEDCTACSHNRTPSTIFDGDIQNYSNSAEVDNLINIMKRISGKRCNRGRRGIGCSGSKSRYNSLSKCYLYVKKGLNDAGLVPDHGELSAKDAGPHLRRAGMKNLLQDPQYEGLSRNNAPRGAVLVYEGGRHGHIEIVGDNGELLSDYDSQNDPLFNGRARRLVGVYVK